MAQQADFSDRDFALRYAEKHGKMAEKFGAEYARKLGARGFSAGKILDMGCGFGGTLLSLLKAFPQAEGVGIDTSEPLLELARQTAVASSLDRRAQFETADAQAVPYPDNSFDVVISTNVLHHVADPVAMLHEIERLLTPGGMLYIADIRRSRLAALFDKAFGEALTYGEALALLYEAKLPKEPFTSGFLWWRYER